MTGHDSSHLTGIHHVSATSAHIGGSYHFHTRMLGLRPVPKTVVRAGR